MKSLSFNSFLFTPLCLYIYLFILPAGAIIPDYMFDELHYISAPTQELGRLNGYRVDIHTVITEDGYVLQVHRFPGGKETPLNCALPPVLVTHILLGDSSGFLHPGPGIGIAYLMADEGYDVWLINIRGTVYSKQNLYVSIDEAAFWDFSWERAGQYDLAATIDYILETTGHEQLLVLAHSQGATEVFALLTLRPEYNDKIQYAIALAPLAYMTFSPGLLRLTQALENAFQLVATVISTGEVLPRNTVVPNAMRDLCILGVSDPICKTLNFVFFGFDFTGFNETLVPIIFGHFSAGASVNMFVHYLQIANSGRFQRFDYGPTKNLKLYGSLEPPLFNLTKITTPMTFFYGLNDAFGDLPDILTLAKQLKNVDLVQVESPTFDHVDFLWGKNLNELVNYKILKIFKEKRVLSDQKFCGPSYEWMLENGKLKRDIIHDRHDCKTKYNNY